MSGKKFYLIGKSDLKNFINSLAKGGNVFAPVIKNNEWNYDKIKNIENLEMKGYINTEFPLKKFLMPDGQIIAKYGAGKIKKGTRPKEKILFGVRPCDVHGIIVLDKVMLSGKTVDICYKDNRNSLIIFALDCKQTGKNCFCDSMETREVNQGFDLLFTEQDKYYHVEVGSKKGAKFVTSNIFKRTDKKAKRKELKFKKRIKTENLTEIMNASFDSKVWENAAKRCLSCASCTSVCPTCYCFDISHVNSVEKGKGKIIRESNYCMLKPFTRVAGNFVFRESRTERLKQFFYHKLVYGKENQGKYHCVGCGRCITECMTGIDITEEVKNVRDDYEKRKLRS